MNKMNKQICKKCRKLNQKLKKYDYIIGLVDKYFVNLDEELLDELVFNSFSVYDAEETNTYLHNDRRYIIELISQLDRIRGNND